MLNDLLLSYDMLKSGEFLFSMTMSAVLVMFQIGLKLLTKIMCLIQKRDYVSILVLPKQLTNFVK